MSLIHDVAIVGAGPAGCCAAAHLAKSGRSVVVFEKEKFPRFHIGESLLPYSMGALERLGVLDRVRAAGMPKYGGEIATACGARAVKFYFKNGFRLKHHQAFQIERATFDQILLERARECGAEIREEAMVEKVALNDEGVTLSIRERSTGGADTVRARYLLDCSGRNSVVGRHLNLKFDYPDLQKFSCYAHYEGVQRDEGMDAGLTRLVRADDYWFWLIPLDERRTSIGLVMDTAFFKSKKMTPEEAIAWAIADSPLMRERMRSSTLVTPVYSVGDYSYRNRELTGPRWMMAGDAAGFIDPIFSTGVFLALHSGERCADALDAILTSPAWQPRLFRRYSREMNQIMDMYLRFVSAWYRDEFIEVFTNPTERFQLAPAINSVLAGNLGNSFAIWWRMQLFYLVLFLQRYVALCPRLESRGGALREHAPSAA